MKSVQKLDRRTVTGILFSLCVIYNSINLIRWGIDLWSILILIGAILLVASMFLCNRNLLSVGIGLYLVDPVVQLINVIKSSFSQASVVLFSDNGTFVDLYDGAQNLYYLLQICSILLTLSGWIVFLIVTLKPKSGKLSVIAAVLLIIGYLVDRGCRSYYLGSNIFTPFDYFLNFVVMAISVVFTGSILSNGDLETSPTRKNMKPKKKVSINTESQLEKVVKLKNLLDAGAITQEEFDEKKKQILGL